METNIYLTGAKRHLLSFGLDMDFVGFRGSSLACVNLHGLSWAFAGPRWPLLACSGCHGFSWAFVGSSLAGKYMKLISWEKKNKEKKYLGAK
jgi:hypothetical protein